MLAEGQVQIRDLVMGPGTPYSLQAGFNPWVLTVRTDATSARSRDHGSWSGAEWRDEVVIPIPVLVEGETRNVAGWLAAHQRLVAAFAPSHTDIELRWVLGGVEYVMFGRPRLVEPHPGNIGLGLAHTRCAFVALDPRIYGPETVLSAGLPSVSGGLTWPVAWPQVWPAQATRGTVVVTNGGTAATYPRLVIHGPVQEPRVTHVQSGRTLAWGMSLEAGQWLDVDTARRTSLINGQVSRSGQMTSREWFELPPGDSEIAFAAAIYDPAAQLTVTFRSAWW